MKKHTLFLFLPIFLVFFAWGLQLGDHLVDNPDRNIAGQYELGKEIPALQNGQKSILLVIVSTTDKPQADLIGLWLFSYFSNEPYTTVMPIYPPGTDSENYDPFLKQDIQLKNVDGVTQLDDTFLDELGIANIWSSGYVIMDLHGLTETLKLSGGLEMLLINSSAEASIDELKDLITDPKSSLTYQTLLFQQVCAHFTLMNSFDELSNLRALFPEHISSNLHPNVLMDDWQKFIKSRNGSFCIFPQTEQIAQSD